VNRSAGTARPPVNPPAVPALAAQPGVRRVSTARRAIPGGRRPLRRHPWECYPRRAAHRGSARGTGCRRAAALRYRHMTGTTTAIRPPAGSPGARIAGRRQPPGAGGIAATARGPATPHRLRWQRPTAPAHPAAARTCQATIAWPEPGSCAGSRAGPHPRASRGRAQAPCQALPAPYRPPLPRGRGPCRAGPARADLAGQHCDVTSYRPDLCRYRQPGASGCRVMSYVPNRLLRTNTSLP
jgi:hypothetical protein